MGPGLVAQSGAGGELMPARHVWVAFYPDWSDVAVFSSELEAARYGVGKADMVVVQAPFGANRAQLEQLARGERPMRSELPPPKPAKPLAEIRSGASK